MSLTLVGGLLLAAPASAGHYYIADVPDVIAQEHHATLKKAGLLDTRGLQARIQTKAGRKALAKETGISLKQLKAWARFLDLMQLNGLGPKMVKLVNAAGVGTLAEFQKASADALQPAMRAANGAARYSEVVPGVEVVRGWIAASRKVPLSLE